MVKVKKLVKKKIVKSTKENTSPSSVSPDLDSALEKIRNEIQTNGLNIKPEEVNMTEEVKAEETTKTKRKAKDTKKNDNKPAAKEPTSVKGPRITEGYKASDLANEFGVDVSILRKALRACKVEKPEQGWIWKNKSDSNLKEIRSKVKEYLKEASKQPSRGAKGAVKNQEEVKKVKTAERKTAVKESVQKKEPTKTKLTKKAAKKTA